SAEPTANTPNSSFSPKGRESGVAFAKPATLQTPWQVQRPLLKNRLVGSTIDWYEHFFAWGSWLSLSE
ncbi:MAG TPA: hypothetical protein VMT91_14260, partial [Anaerolineales bacterium]|nr:hypothetical protein [Anaerolineales bacterium]